MSSDEAPVRVVLERCAQRCSSCRMSKQLPESSRPFLVAVRLNNTAKNEMILRTGQVPPEDVVCLNVECGGAMAAIPIINKIQVLLR